MIGVFEFEVVVEIVIVAFLVPLALGVNVTSYVAVPPPAILVGTLLTTNSELLDITVTEEAVAPAFEIV